MMKWREPEQEIVAETIRVYKESDLPSPGFHDAYRYWNAKRGDRIAPRYDQIDLLDLTEILDDIAFSEVIGGGDDFKAGFVGKNIVSVLGSEMKGSLVSAMQSDRFRDRGLYLMRVCVTEKCPVTTRLRPSTVFDKEYYLSSILHLPLSTNGTDIDRVFTVALYLLNTSDN